MVLVDDCILSILSPVRFLERSHNHSICSLFKLQVDFSMCSLKKPDFMIS